jgi:hypothetical protein
MTDYKRFDGKRFDGLVTEIKINGVPLVPFDLEGFPSMEYPRGPMPIDMTATVKMRAEPGALEALRRRAIEESPANIMTAGIYGMQQLMLAGATPYDAYTFACWYGRALGVPHVSDLDTLNLWHEAGGRCRRVCTICGNAEYNDGER